MTTPEDVQKLAALARIHVEAADLEKFTKEFDAILAYVGQLETLDVSKSGHTVSPLHNVMRDDGEPHAPGLYTEKIASQFPAREGDALSVKQIITYEEAK